MVKSSESSSLDELLSKKKISKILRFCKILRIDSIILTPVLIRESCYLEICKKQEEKFTVCFFFPSPQSILKVSFE